MKKILVLLAVAFVLATGSVNVLTGYPQSATSDAFRPGMLN